MHVSADFFRLCGANALHGRTFTAEDDLPNAPKTVVLAYAFWQRHFGGDPQVIGRRMTLSGERYEIIGVVGSNLANGQIAKRCWDPATSKSTSRRTSIFPSSSTPTARSMAITSMSPDA